MRGLAFDPDNFVPSQGARARCQEPRSSTPKSEWLPAVGTVAGIRPKHNEQLLPAWRNGLNQLNSMDAPSDADPARWHQLVLDAHRLAWGWHVEAVDMGWSLGALFGFDRGEAYGAVGLALDIRGGRVVNLYQDERGRDVASILTHAGDYRSHHRRISDDAPPLWLAAEPRR